MGFELRPSSQKQFDALIGSDVDKWRRILKETGITIN
jgi:hypothetical protein